VDALLLALPTTACSGATAGELAKLLGRSPAADRATGAHAIPPAIADVVGHSIAVWHPRSAAHLHCPVLIPALAAEVVIAALNQSMDSFDQAPAATVIEQQMLTWLTSLAGLPAGAGGTFTAGGTQSNYMGLLLARDHHAERRWQWRVHRDGLPPDAARMRIFCSEASHFSVEKSAIQLGLGTQAVVKIPVDADRRMRPDALVLAITAARDAGLEPAAIVATAGTTDFGSFDPLRAIAAIARQHGLWLHVDAAYGGALLMSDRHRHLLDGLDAADSVTLDFHKAFFQPISCGAFLLADSERFRFIRVVADYLNPEAHEDADIPDLVTRSVLTTRRFDALKLWWSLQALGVHGFAEMIDRLVELGVYAASRIRSNPRLVLLHEPAFGCVVFRYRAEGSARESAHVNAAIPREYYRRGMGVLGHTVIDRSPALKLTFLNPCTSAEDVDAGLDALIALGSELETASRLVGA
jgi:L-2,4-diaminobutyrate decarboxylase